MTIEKSIYISVFKKTIGDWHLNSKQTYLEPEYRFTSLWLYLAYLRTLDYAILLASIIL
jgi:hypothetical protein